MRFDTILASPWISRASDPRSARMRGEESDDERYPQRPSNASISSLRLLHRASQSRTNTAIDLSSAGVTFDD
jgi:hypothetical protein